MRYLNLDSVKTTLCIKKEKEKEKNTKKTSKNFLIDRLYTIRHNSFQGNISVMVNSHRKDLL